MVNGEIFDAQLLDVLPGEYVVKVRLLKDGEVLAERENLFRIEG